MDVWVYKCILGHSFVTSPHSLEGLLQGLKNSLSDCGQLFSVGEKILGER